MLFEIARPGHEIWVAAQECCGEQYHRFDACVPVPGTYVPETGTPPPFPNGMELADAR